MQMKSETIVTDQELSTEVVQAIKNGHKIAAIKLLREQTGLGLANAKVLVDRASAQYVDKNPAPVITESENRGASLLALLLLVAVIFAVYRLFLTA